MDKVSFLDSHAVHIMDQHRLKALGRMENSMEEVHTWEIHIMIR